MTPVILTHANDALAATKRVREELFNELSTKIAPIIEQINERIAKAISEGKVYIELTREEIESVPDTEPGLFTGFLKSRGFTIFQIQADVFGLYFYNPEKESL